MKNSVHCGAWTINPVSSSGTPPVHPSRNSLRKSLAARIPTVVAPFFGWEPPVAEGNLFLRAETMALKRAVTFN
jgi:hypothetical protein